MIKVTNAQIVALLHRRYSAQAAEQGSLADTEVTVNELRRRHTYSSFAPPDKCLLR
jgi:hypothetical protein